MEDWNMGSYDVDRIGRLCALASEVGLRIRTNCTFSNLAEYHNILEELLINLEPLFNKKERKKFRNIVEVVKRWLEEGNFLQGEGYEDPLLLEKIMDKLRNMHRNILILKQVRKFGIPRGEKYTQKQVTKKGMELT